MAARFDAIIVGTGQSGPSLVRSPVDMAAVKSRKDGVVRQSNEGVSKWLKEMDDLTVHEGHGRLEASGGPSPWPLKSPGDVGRSDRTARRVGSVFSSTHPASRTGAVPLPDSGL